MTLPERQTVTGRHGKVVRATFALSGFDVVARAHPASPVRGWVSHGTVGGGSTSSPGVHVGERSLGLVVGYPARALEQRGWAGVKTSSWEPQAAEGSVPGQQRGRGSRPGQGGQGRVEAGG